MSLRILSAAAVRSGGHIASARSRWLIAATRSGGSACSQGLTLVHFSAQRKHILLHIRGVHVFPPVYWTGGHGEV